MSPIDYSQSKYGKGETRKRVKARVTRIRPSRKAQQRRRDESAVVKAVRPLVAERDGYCRLMWLNDVARGQVAAIFGGCQGRSEWSHWNDTHRRSKTRNQAPAERHNRRYSLMLCAFHSQAYDQHRMEIEALTEKYCDGPLRFVKVGQIWEEPA